MQCKINAWGKLVFRGESAQSPSSTDVISKYFQVEEVVKNLGINKNLKFDYIVFTNKYGMKGDRKI